MPPQWAVNIDTDIPLCLEQNNDTACVHGGGDLVGSDAGVCVCVSEFLQDYVLILK